MKQKNTQQRIEGKGYEVTYLLDKGVIATKGDITHKAKNITHLLKPIIK